MRQEELWGWWPPAHSTQPGPAGVRAEPAAPLPPGRSSDGSALFPHVGQSMTGPELFPEAALCAFLGLADKGGCAAPARSVLTVVEGDSTSGAGHTGRTAARGPGQLPSAAPAVCRGGGSDLPQGWEELGRTGTFSTCSQREPGLPTNLVTSKLVSQILLSLAEACWPACLLHSLWAAKPFFKVLKSGPYMLKLLSGTARCPQLPGTGDIPR